MQNEMVEMIKLVGGLAGLIVFFWKVLEEFKSYPKIKVSVLRESDKCTIGTEVENTNKFKYKKITNSYIIISQERHAINAVINTIKKHLGMNQELNSNYDFNKINCDFPVYLEQSICLIPLDFYYKENPFICDERITYRASLDVNNLNKGSYSVRFYIFGDNGYFRVTQELLDI